MRQGDDWYEKPRNIYEIVRQYPSELADALEQQGYDVDTLIEMMGL